MATPRFTNPDHVDNEPYCIYCYRTVTVEEPPALDDDESWERLTQEHEEDCDWVLTRAHRKEQPFLTPWFTDAL